MESTELFVGVPITPDIKESLDAASLPFRRYFEGGKFLTVVERGDESWLGKAISRNASPDRVDDMRRHVRSVILKIDPGNEIPVFGIQVIELPIVIPDPVPDPVPDPAPDPGPDPV